MRISKLLSFFALLLPLHTFAEVYDVSTTAELREALASAAAAGGDNTIRLAAGTYSTQDDGEGTFEYFSEYTTDLRLEGSDPEEVIISGAAKDTILRHRTTEPAALYLTNITFQDSRSEYDAAVNTTGYVSVSNCIFLNNNAKRGGFSSGLNADVIDSKFQNNLATGFLASSWRAVTTVTNSIFLDHDRVQHCDEDGCINSISNFGFGLRSGGEIRLNSSKFINNDVAFADLDNDLLISNSEFSDNKYGAFNVSPMGGSLTISDSIFRNNGYGWTELSDLRLPSSGNGSAIRVSGNGTYVTLEIERSVFEQNQGSFGGAIWLGGNISKAEIRNSVFLRNSAMDQSEINYSPPTPFTGQAGGSIWDEWGTPLTILNSLFSEENNSLFLRGTENTVSNNVFLNGSQSFITGRDNDVPLVTLKNNVIDETLVNVDSISSGNIFDGTAFELVNETEGNYRLTPSSPLIDQGLVDPVVEYGDKDLAGNTRITGTSIDIGPYEYDPDALIDSDGDGVPDTADNCPTVANAEQVDFDSDGKGDVCDSDDDNDGTNDEDDAFPFDDTESLDTDGDGIGNNEDYDDDADGIIDGYDYQPLVANSIIVDTDGDGFPDPLDDFPTDASRQVSDDGDFDGDGYTNDEEVDYCSNPFDKNSQPDIGGLSLPLIQVLTEQ